MKSQRLLSMMLLLQTRHQMTALELAEELGVSVRTVLRDVIALADADVPVFAERGRYGGVVLLPGPIWTRSPTSGATTRCVHTQSH
ncbi:HTH domain-containing protein [Cryobacterium sp. N21]|uniref:helix-turn-helix transcriptional regulator n=1 Tax=Cryobacterium sp. N21 TaxID=2048289 RepID=UPI0018EB8CEC